MANERSADGRREPCAGSTSAPSTTSPSPSPTELARRLRGLLERIERDERQELRRENIILNVWAPPTTRRDIRKRRAFRQMYESAIVVYDGTEDECVADWAREALRLLDKRS